jgi:hypothetical protein
MSPCSLPREVGNSDCRAEIKSSNSGSPRIVVADLVDHYIQTELSDESGFGAESWGIGPFTSHYYVVEICFSAGPSSPAATSEARSRSPKAGALRHFPRDASVTCVMELQTICQRLRIRVSRRGVVHFRAVPTAAGRECVGCSAPQKLIELMPISATCSAFCQTSYGTTHYRTTQGGFRFPCFISPRFTKTWGAT